MRRRRVRAHQGHAAATNALWREQPPAFVTLCRVEDHKGVSIVLTKFSACVLNCNCCVRCRGSQICCYSNLAFCPNCPGTRACFSIEQKGQW